MIQIPKLDVDQFMTFFMAPLWTMGMETEAAEAAEAAADVVGVALLGEMQKYVPISKERILSLQLSGSQSITIGLQVST